MALPVVRPNTADIDTALLEARHSYSIRRPESQRAHEVATRVMPGGNTRTVLFHKPFPLRITHGKGARLWDIDGNEYLNLLGEFTAGIFGHTHPVIHKAIKDALERGINLSAHTNAEISLAGQIKQRFHSMDLLRFTNSGTEANLMAVMASRIVAKREVVMVFAGGYHGGVFHFGGGGSPVNAPFPYVVGRFNDVVGTWNILREQGRQIACVLMEPMIGSGGCIPVRRAFLSMLREETHRCGAALIFDEVMTSRLSMGGAQQLFNVRPDMTTLGKYIGGGMSFGAFGGAERFMTIFDPRLTDSIPHAGTFNNNALTMAAGSAALSQVLTKDALDDLNRRGDNLRRRLNELFATLSVNMQATGIGSLLNIHPQRGEISDPDQLVASDDRIKELLFLDLLDAGFYMARRGFIALSLAVTDDDLNNFIQKIEQILRDRRPIFEIA